MTAVWIMGGLVAYIVGVLVTYRIAYVYEYEAARRDVPFPGHAPHWDDRARSEAKFTATIWPFIALFFCVVGPFLAAGWLLDRSTPTPPSVEADRREAELRERERRIRDLEREAGL